MSDGMGRELAYLSSHATNRYFIPNWGNNYLSSEAFYAGYTYRVKPISNWQNYLPIPVSVTNINPDVAQNAGY